MLKVKGWKKCSMLLFSNQERAGMAISIFDNKDLISKCVIGDKEWFYILIKVSNHQSDIIFINVYTTNNRIPTYMKQTLTELKKEIVIKYVSIVPLELVY